MAESIPRYTSKAEGFRDADELAALRPVKANAPKPRKPSAKRAAVASGIVCFCGERFSEAQALEFMKHLRAEAGEVLEWRERERARHHRANMRPEVAEHAREADRRRAQAPGYREWHAKYERERMADPEKRERRNAKKRTPEQREYDRERRAANPERHRESQRKYRARKKAEREAGMA